MELIVPCEQLAKRSYMIKCNLIITCIHWQLCRKYEIKVTRNWYEHVPLPYTVTQTGLEILWDVEIKTTTKIKHNRPDIVVKMPEQRKWQLIDVAIPQDHNIVSKENEKVNKYIDLASVIRTVHKVQTEIVLLVIGALGSVSKRLKTYIDVIGNPNVTGSAQISTVTSTARILRDVLSL